MIYFMENPNLKWMNMANCSSMKKFFFSSMFAIKSHSHPFPKGLAVSRVETGWRFHQVDIAGIPFESFFVQGKTPVRPSASVRKMRPPEPPGNLY